jgi:hypothetical protein
MYDELPHGWREMFMEVSWAGAATGQERSLQLHIAFEPAEV